MHQTKIRYVIDLKEKITDAIAFTDEAILQETWHVDAIHNSFSISLSPSAYCLIKFYWVTKPLPGYHADVSFELSCDNLPIFLLRERDTVLPGRESVIIPRRKWVMRYEGYFPQGYYTSVF